MADSKLREYLQEQVEGETVGDTLKRLGTLLMSVRMDSHAYRLCDWQDWLYDTGTKLNELAEEEDG